MKKAASASKHWRLLSYLCSIRKAEVHNKLCAHGLRHLLQFFILELSCFHPLVECLRGGVHPPGKFSFFYFGNSFGHFDFRWEIHVHHLTASINDFLYFVKKYFQKYRFFFKKSLDIIKEILYNIGVRRSGKLTGKENRPMDEKARRIYMNRERRKALQAIIDQLETLQTQLEEIQTEEEEYRDNIPENFQSGERYEHIEEICESLSDAVSSLEDATSSIEEAIE